MALFAKHNQEKFGVGDLVRVNQIVKEGEKKRKQVFEGIVIKIKGEPENKTFTVRRIGAQKIGIEKIFPLNSPVVDSIEVVKKGMRGVKRANLKYIRGKSKREIEKIYSRAVLKENTKKKNIDVKKQKAKKKSKPKSKKVKSKSKKTSKSKVQKKSTKKK